ncbi:hypothetical protein ACFL56_02985 [Candidatus Margulisiibacteriota bacterium]
MLILETILSIWYFIRFMVPAWRYYEELFLERFKHQNFFIRRWTRIREQHEADFTDRGRRTHDLVDHLPNKGIKIRKHTKDKEDYGLFIRKMGRKDQKHAVNVGKAIGLSNVSQFVKNVYIFITDRWFFAWFKHIKKERKKVVKKIDKGVIPEEKLPEGIPEDIQGVYPVHKVNFVLKERKTKNIKGKSDTTV